MAVGLLLFLDGDDRGEFEMKLSTSREVSLRSQQRPDGWWPERRIRISFARRHSWRVRAYSPRQFAGTSRWRSVSSPS